MSLDELLQIREMLRGWHTVKWEAATEEQLLRIRDTLGGFHPIKWEGETIYKGRIDSDLVLAALERRIKTYEAVIRSERFKIIDEIGNGHLGHVYEAADLETGEVVAIKVHEPTTLGERITKGLGYVTPQGQHMDEESIIRSEAIGSATAGNIVHREFFRDDRRTEQHPKGRPFVKMHRYRQNLQDYMRWARTQERENAAPSGLTYLEIKQLAVGIANGLGELHEKFGRIHGDLKPENIIIDRAHEQSTGLTPLLNDFGASPIAISNEAARFQAEEDASRFAMGAPYIRAPTVSRMKYADETSDAYSLGALLHYLYTGTFPLQHELDALQELGGDEAINEYLAQHATKERIPHQERTGFREDWETHPDGIMRWTNNGLKDKLEGLLADTTTIPTEISKGIIELMTIPGGQAIYSPRQYVEQLFTQHERKEQKRARRNNRLKGAAYGALLLAAGALGVKGTTALRDTLRADDAKKEWLIESMHSPHAENYIWQQEQTTPANSEERKDDVTIHGPVYDAIRDQSVATDQGVVALLLREMRKTYDQLGITPPPSLGGEGNTDMTSWCLLPDDFFERYGCIVVDAPTMRHLLLKERLDQRDPNIGTSDRGLEAELRWYEILVNAEDDTREVFTESYTTRLDIEDVAVEALYGKQWLDLAKELSSSQDYADYRNTAVFTDAQRETMDAYISNLRRALPDSRVVKKGQEIDRTIREKPGNPYFYLQRKWTDESGNDSTHTEMQEQLSRIDSLLYEADRTANFIADIANMQVPSASPDSTQVARMKRIVNDYLTGND